jgi:hypothetical protein
MLWDIAIFALTMIGIRCKELWMRSQLWHVLAKQGTGYIIAAVLPSIPITESPLSLLSRRHSLMSIQGCLHPTIKWYV